MGVMGDEKLILVLFFKARYAPGIFEQFDRRLKNISSKHEAF